MPYKNASDSKLPDRVKAMSLDKRRQFVATFNNVFNRCRANGGRVNRCEGEAMRSANAAVSD